MRLRSVLVGSAFFAALLPLVVAHAAPGRVEDGKALAREACAACHQVTPEQQPPRPVYNPDEGNAVRAPSFVAIARDPTRTDDYLRAIITRPHYPMREQMIDNEDLEALVAYIGSLRPAAARARR